jgi:hypothetical protein
MIYDCFTFFNEADVLAIRLAELRSVVHVHVLAESVETFTGKPKPLHFQERMFEQAKGSTISILEVGKMPDNLTAWDREARQRNALAVGVMAGQDDDVVIISDADEIPRAEVVANYRPSDGIVGLVMPNHYYRLNTPGGGTVNRARICTVRHVKEMGCHDIRCYEPDKYIDDAGWHFSYLGDADHIAHKLKSFSHTEYSGDEFTNREHLDHCIAHGIDPFRRGERYLPVAIDDKYPAHVRNNVEAFKKRGLVA